MGSASKSITNSIHRDCFTNENPCIVCHLSCSEPIKHMHNICGKKSRKFLKYTIHACDICDKCFFNEEKMKIHFRKHPWEHFG